jgi:superfamily I DNA/RNA helicase
MFTPEQQTVIEHSVNNRLFLSGSSGTGKTICGIERIKYLIKSGIPADSILLLTPQRTLQESYLNAIHGPEMTPGGELTPATIGGLARRLVDLFWPIAVDSAGFAHPDQPPLFLTLETAQYYMARLVRPHLENGWFESVVMDRNRLYSQIIDNLNKSAAIGFPYTEIVSRLTSAWSGDSAQRRVYMDAQSCASEFRQYCLDNNLLDFSLQLEIFTNLYWNEPILRDYLKRTYRHIIYDNVEEDIPVSHDILKDWLPDVESALIIYDDDAGYRRFLGADPDSAFSLSTLCDESFHFEESFVTNLELVNLANGIAASLSPSSDRIQSSRVNTEGILEVISERFYPEMLDRIVDEINKLVNNGTSPFEIVVLAPYLSDALRFSLMDRLEQRSIPTRSHRPSRSLKEEPASQCLLTLAELAHPQWGLQPTKYDVAHAFLQAIEGMDLVRAQILTEIVYRMRGMSLGTFDQINGEMQERITYRLGEQYEKLREWIESYRLEEPQQLDHFLRKLFGEILSQPGYNLHREADSARVAASLIESIQKFRLSLDRANISSDEIGKEYIAMLQDGVISAQYVSAWVSDTDNAVLIAPAHTYLMSNRPVDVQFWLDIGSSGWYERLFQPLTHPYVLSRNWKVGQEWTDADEVEANNATLARLVTGLLRRCRKKIYLCLSEMGESGFEQRGVLLRAFNQVLTQSNP